MLEKSHSVLKYELEHRIATRIIMPVAYYVPGTVLDAGDMATSLNKHGGYSSQASET